MAFDENQVYRVRSEEDPSALIALDVQIRDGNLTWFDTNRDRGHRLKTVHKAGKNEVFETENGARYEFEPLTKEIYDREVKSLVELSPSFSSTEELRQFYLRKFLGKDEGP